MGQSDICSACGNPHEASVFTISDNTNSLICSCGNVDVVVMGKK